MDSQLKLNTGLTMTEESRRKVLKGLAVTVPVVWATPVVESVILPAHAHVSNCGKFRCPEESDCDILFECGLGEPTNEALTACLNAHCLYGPDDAVMCEEVCD